MHKPRTNRNTAREQLRILGIESKNRKLISCASMEWIFTNPLYYGVIKRNGEYYDGKFEPLITKELFDAVQKRLKERSQPREVKHPHAFGFLGLLMCGECGCAITAQVAKGNGGIYRYYRCTKGRVKCSQSYLREDLMKSQFVSGLHKIALPDGWAHEMRAQIDKWEMEEQQDLILFAQTVNRQHSMD